MFKFFQRENTEANKTNENLVSINYFVPKESNQPNIDIELSDYSHQSIEALCSLLKVLGSDMFFVETINMIKSSLIKEQREDILIEIFSKISPLIKAKFIDPKKQEGKKTCIQPSDMLT